MNKVMELMEKLNAENTIVDRELQDAMFDIVVSNFDIKEYSSVDEFLLGLQRATCEGGSFTGLCLYVETDEIFRKFSVEFIETLHDMEEIGYGKVDMQVYHIVWACFEYYKNQLVDLVQEHYFF